MKKIESARRDVVRIRVDPSIGIGIDAAIRVPGSKSLTNRALILAAQSEGPTQLSACSRSDDSAVLIAALRRCGVEILENAAETTLVVRGRARQGAASMQSIACELEGAGSSLRFLSALLASWPGSYRLTANAQLSRRPLKPLLDALQELGAHVDSAEGSPPLELRGANLQGKALGLRQDLSSQFTSALLMIAPSCKGGLRLEVDSQRAASWSYVEMTIALMQSFGVEVRQKQSGSSLHLQVAEVEGDFSYRMPHGTYRCEADAASAAYFGAAVAILGGKIQGGKIQLLGLHLDSVQGEIQAFRCFHAMGASLSETADGLLLSCSQATLSGIDVSMRDAPDSAMTVAVLALFANSPTRIRGIAHNRHKESDRIVDFLRELERLGVQAEEHADGFTIHPIDFERFKACTQGQDLVIETYGDHRMVMAFSVLALGLPGFAIADPDAVTKSYPSFFRDLGALGIKVERASQQFPI